MSALFSLYGAMAVLAAVVVVVGVIAVFLHDLYCRITGKPVPQMYTVRLHVEGEYSMRVRAKDAVAAGEKAKRLLGEDGFGNFDELKEVAIEVESVDGDVVKAV